MAEALGSSEEFDKLVKGSKMVVGSGTIEEPKVNRMHYSPERVRVAVICPKCNARRFGNRDWRCKEHNLGELQTNHSYFGRNT